MLLALWGRGGRAGRGAAAAPFDERICGERDMPANGRRFVQKVEGYEATLCAGVPIFERGEHTGALPGKLVRAGRSDAANRVAAE